MALPGTAGADSLDPMAMPALANDSAALALPAPDPKNELNTAIGENLDDAAALLSSWLTPGASETDEDGLPA